MKTDLRLRAGQISAFLERYSWGLGAIFFVIAIFTMSSYRPVAVVFWSLALICFWWPALVKAKVEFLRARPDGPDGHRNQSTKHTD